MLRYSDTGAFVDIFVTSRSGGPNGGRGLAFSPGGDLFVVSQSTNSVLRYNGLTGAFLSTFIVRLWMVQLQQFNGTTGAYVGNFAGPGPVDLNSPLYIDFGSGELAVSTNTDRVFRYNASTGAYQSSFVRDTPRGVSYGPGGNLFIAQSISGNVWTR